MLNILKGVKLAQDDSTGDVYAVDCADGPKKLTGGSSGGSASMTDDGILECLIATDMLSAVKGADGAILTDENSKILLM